jgi:hypothetical protein
MRIFSVILALCAPLPAAAQSSGSVQLNGFIIGTCAVVVGAAGTLAVNGAGNDLSSANSGGSPALAVITTTSIGYFVHVDQPTGFSVAPTGVPGDAAFTASYSATGATTASSTFPAGTYQLPVTVRCATS